MIILGIETSCDETALSLIEVTEQESAEGPIPRFKVLGNSLISQIKIHEQYGGVFPVVAKREHAKNLVPLLYKILSEAKLLTEHSSARLSNEKELRNILERESELPDLLLTFLETHDKPAIDAIAVTYGPGLEPALWVGISFAKALGKAWELPVIPVNHMEGHIVAGLLDHANIEETRAHEGLPLKQLTFPVIALLISGGHTELVLVKSWREYEVVGKTRDDAVGEAFDKVARILGLPYPGGPQISRIAKADRTNHPKPLKEYLMPRPMLHSHDLNFSFSGLKTAVLYFVKKLPADAQDQAGQLTEATKEHIARGFEDAVVDVIVAKTKTALEEYGAQALIVGGGVTANEQIRTKLKELAQSMDISAHLAEHHLSTDNALMIALAGYFVYKAGASVASESITAQGNLSF